MPTDRIVAAVVVLLLALWDYMFGPPVTKMPEETKIVEQVEGKRNADISIIGEIGEYRMDEVVKIQCQVKNTGEVRHSFPVDIQVSGSGIEEMLPFKRVMLEKEQSESIEFEYKIPDNAKEGRVSAVVSIWDRIEGSRPAQKYAEDKKDFNLVDGPPQINFLNLGLSANVGERLNLKIRAKDDRGVRRVKIFYQFPGMNSRKEAIMTRSSGNEKDGVWVFVTDPSPQTGKFIFSIEAMDTKSQIASTEEYRIAIVTKR